MERSLKLLSREMTVTRLIILAGLVFLLFYNWAFFQKVVEIYPLTTKNAGFLASLALMLWAFFVFLMSLVCYRRTVKPVLVFFLLLSSFAAYFMDTYGVIIDDSMLRNVMKTDLNESLDLLSLRMILYFLLLGLLPVVLVMAVRLRPQSLRQAVKQRLLLSLGSLFTGVALIFAFGSTYASFFREHKPLRYYTNPSYYIYSTIKVARQELAAPPGDSRRIAEDAHLPEEHPHKELLIFVLGETARYDRFSLNGYERETNPLLKKEEIYAFSNFWSCGTSTAVSVPCMFSIYDKDSYSESAVQSTENILDVLKREGVEILWRDNNSDSKGVALRVPYENFKGPDKNPECDTECRDIGMLSGLQEYIDSHADSEMLIVLHAMGNHGPAYYKRYPESFEKFTPVCKTNQLEECSRDEIDNAYDNAILYTDYFLSEVIALLKRNSERFETGMIYISDHGESLGEHGLYLHGMPYMLSPEAQRHVPAFMWFGESYDEIDRAAVTSRLDRKYSHDNLFHTILGLLEIETSEYDREMDIVFGP
jgi:lipid A ethanolaminephosphotransferase